MIRYFVILGKGAALAALLGLVSSGILSLGCWGSTVASSNTERVIASLRPKFLACYNRGRADDPEMVGSVTIVVALEPNGEVAVADGESITGLSPEVVRCFEHAAMGARFDPPLADGGGSTVRMTMRFVQGT
ncbi:MAG TPA: hypothetical protein VNO21_13410 [Polyangiaceae bacterium]|nr:hypothetical protein [Polyangiaceae bacterium]